MKDWFEQDWGKELIDWADKFDQDLPENKREAIDEAIDNLPESKDSYYEEIIEKCNQVFEGVEFVDFEESDQFPHIVFLELENGNVWDADLHPMKHLLHEVNNKNYEETLKKEFQQRNS